MSDELLVAPCKQDAARFAVTRWHYSRRMPTPPLVRFGVWESSRFVGVVIFGRGGSSHLMDPYRLDATQGAELVRIALRQHDRPVSQIVTRAIKLLRASSPGLRLLVSFADPAYGHHGGIYQAMGWLYTGTTSPTPMFRDWLGDLHHNRVVSQSGWKTQYGERKRVLRTSEVERVLVPGKHRYLLPLDRATRRRVAHLAQPYPARAAEVSAGDTTPFHGVEAGSTPAGRSLKGA